MTDVLSTEAARNRRLWMILRAACLMIAKAIEKELALDKRSQNEKHLTNCEPMG
jgi:hypothetical protein